MLYKHGFIIIIITALALCYSSAEYACPVWERSAHAKRINPALNATCRLVSGCLRPTPTDSLYILSGIAPSEIRRSAASSNDQLWQVTDVRHPMHGHVPAKSRLKSRRSFLNKVEPNEAAYVRQTLWKERLAIANHPTPLSTFVGEERPPGADASWTEWKCLNHCRSGTSRCKVTLTEWGYLEDDLTCQCGSEPLIMNHLLRCPLLEKECTAQDLAGWVQRLC